jgi:hypothetical protein
MASVRRHLASLGLAVVLCHMVMQVLVPAALCCQKPLVSGTTTVTRECCPMGSHPGQVCPMHGKRVVNAKSGSPDCAARPVVDLHDILMTLSNGGVIPTLVALAVPGGSESVPASVQPAAAFVISPPLGPPPRV